MRIINSKVHGIIDFAMVGLLIASPWLFNFTHSSTAQGIAVVTGAFLLFLSLFTDYEFGFKRMIGLKAHLNTDIVAGLFLAFSPWLLGFNDIVYLPHLLLGLGEVSVALISQRIPYDVAHRTPNLSQRKKIPS